MGNAKALKFSGLNKGAIITCDYEEEITSENFTISDWE